MYRMKTVCGTLVACAFAVSLQAQDTTIKSKTKIKTDDAKPVTLTGCLQEGPDTNTFLLASASSNQVASTDKSSEAPVGTSGTAGAATTYELTTKEGVDLSAHLGHRVEVQAIAIPAASGSDDDAKLSTETKTKVEKDDAPDEKVETKTKAEIARGASPRMMVASLKHLSGSCQ